MKKILKNRELRILVYFVLMAIAYYILLFKFGGVSFIDIDTDSISYPLMYLLISFLKFALNSAIYITLVLPILLKAILSFVCIILQFIAVLSKKGKRALNYVSSIINLLSSVFLLAILQKLLSLIIVHISSLRGVVDGNPRVIVVDGKINYKNMKKELYTMI